MLREAHDLAFARFLRSGDRDDFAEVFDATVADLLAVASLIAPDPDAAEDLVQTTYLVALEHSASFDRSLSVLPWLLGILRNRARVMHRAHRRQPRLPNRACDSVPDPAALAEGQEVEDVLRAAIGRTSEPYRSVLYLYLLEGRQASEIASALGRRAATVRTQLVRGLRRLRLELPTGLASGGVLTSLSTLRVERIRRKLMLSSMDVGVLNPIASVLSAKCALLAIMISTCSALLGLIFLRLIVTPALASSPICVSTGSVGATSARVHEGSAGSFKASMAHQPVAFSRRALSVGRDLAPALAARAMGPTLVVPSALEGEEGISGGTIAGFSARYRQQILVDGAMLRGNKTITALWFRRDDTFGKTFKRSTSHLSIQLSRARRLTTAPSRYFANNRSPDFVTVFDGIVELPRSENPPIPAPWAYPHAVRIGFSRAYGYMGGDLCIDIDGTPLNPPSNLVWWVDYLHEADVGSVQSVGVPCGAPATENVTTAASWGRNIVPGGTFSFVSFGWPGTPCIMMIGTPLPVPVPLDVIGASGCVVYVQPEIQIVTRYPREVFFGTFSACYVDLHVLSSPMFLGASFRVQCVNLESSPTSNPAGLTATNAVDITIASSMPPGIVSMVRSDPVREGDPFPGIGYVYISRAPVLRFEYR